MVSRAPGKSVLELNWTEQVELEDDRIFELHLECPAQHDDSGMDGTVVHSYCKKKRMIRS